MGPGDPISLQSSSLEKEAKDTIIIHPIGETQVNHIQVDVLKVKIFFLYLYTLIFTYGNTASGDK